MDFIRKAFEFLSRPTQSRTMGLVVMLLLVTAVSLTVYVAQQQQQIKQQASDASCLSQLENAMDTCRNTGRECIRNCSTNFGRNDCALFDPQDPEVCTRNLSACQQNCTISQSACEQDVAFSFVCRQTTPALVPTAAPTPTPAPATLQSCNNQCDLQFDIDSNFNNLDACRNNCASLFPTAPTATPTIPTLAPVPPTATSTATAAPPPTPKPVTSCGTNKSPSDPYIAQNTPCTQDGKTGVCNGDGTCVVAPTVAPTVQVPIPICPLSSSILCQASSPGPSCGLLFVQTTNCPTPNQCWICTPTPAPSSLGGTPAVSGIQLALTITQQGLTTTPLNINRQVTVIVRGADNQTITKTGAVTYSGGTFNGTINIGVLPNGSYKLKVKAGSFLKSFTADLVISGAAASTQTKVIAGLDDQDNIDAILFYNGLRACFGSNIGFKKCNTPQDVDLNGDGNVDIVDYQIYLKGIRNLKQGLPVQ